MSNNCVGKGLLTFTGTHWHTHWHTLTHTMHTTTHLCFSAKNGNSIMKLCYDVSWHNKHRCQLETSPGTSQRLVKDQSQTSWGPVRDKWGLVIVNEAWPPGGRISPSKLVYWRQHFDVGSWKLASQTGELLSPILPNGGLFVHSALPDDQYLTWYWFMCGQFRTTGRADRVGRAGQATAVRNMASWNQARRRSRR